MKTVQWKMSSKIGPLYLVASATGLRGLYWKKRPDALLAALEGSSPEVFVLKRARDQLEEYFAGGRRGFDLPLEPEGTDFQKKVWEQLRLIPYGCTVSYRDIARRIRNGNAVRAVGSANARNPIGIIVPCHRVIAADGKLAGFAGGLPIKRRLLELERQTGAVKPGG